MQRNFETQDCNGWITQVGTARYAVFQVNNDNLSRQFLGQRVAVNWVTFVMSVVALGLLLLMSALQRGKRKWTMVLIQGFWVLSQIPNLEVSTRVFRMVSPENTSMDEIMHPFEVDRINNIGYAVNQFLIMMLMITIWLAIDYFKQTHAEIIDHQEIKHDLKHTLKKERKAGGIFFIANFVYQTVVFIAQSALVAEVAQTNADNAMLLPPQPFDQNIANVAVFLGLMDIFFIIGYLTLMAWNLQSLVKLIKLSVEYNWQKTLLWGALPILTILYINDVFSMMLYYWGLPAYKMTQASAGIMDGNVGFINSDDYCWSTIRYEAVTQPITEGEAPQREIMLTSFGGFLRVIFGVSGFTPLIWSFVFAVGFVGMQYDEKLGGRPIHHDQAQKRQALMTKNINFTQNTTQNTDLSNSGQTMDMSRNELK